MAQTRIEQLINEIYDFVEECKPTPLSQSKIIVPKDQLLDLVDELKRRTPDEIKRYQKIIANRDSIIAQAEERAREIESTAREHAEMLVNETEIVQSAYKKANEIIQNATNEAERLKNESEQAAENLRVGVLTYTGDILTNIESLLASSYRETKETSDKLVNLLHDRFLTISDNKREILDQLNGNTSSDDEDGEEDYDDEDFNLPEVNFPEDDE